MTKKEKQRIASMMIVDLLVMGKDVKALATKLVNEFAYGTDKGFDLVCSEVGAMYRDN